MFAADFRHVLRREAFAQQGAEKPASFRAQVIAAALALAETLQPAAFLPAVQNLSQVGGQRRVFGDVRDQPARHALKAGLPLCGEEKAHVALVPRIVPALDIALIFEEFEALGDAALRLPEIFAQGLGRVRIAVAQREVAQDFEVDELHPFRARSPAHQAVVQGGHTFQPDFFFRIHNSYSIVSKRY